MKTTKALQLDYIQSLKDSVSWADEICTLEINDNAFACTDVLYYVPIHWEDYLLLEPTYYDNPAVRVGTVDVGEQIIPTCFLIGGNPPKSVAGIITQRWMAEFSNGCGFRVLFVDAISQIEFTSALIARLDGVDWGRTLNGYIEDGREGQLVMEWD